MYQIPNQLHHLQFASWCDNYARATALENATAHKAHFCEAVRDNCSRELMSLQISPHRLCGDMFRDTKWPHLQKIVVDMMDFKPCDGKAPEDSIREAVGTMTARKMRYEPIFKLGSSLFIFCSILVYGTYSNDDRTLGTPHVHFQRVPALPGQ